MDALCKKICSVFLAGVAVVLFGLGCVPGSKTIKQAAKFVKTVPISACCTFNYSNSLIRNRTTEDTFYSAAEGEAGLQRNISIRQFNERIFFAEENDLPVLTDVPDEKTKKTGQKWWPVPMIAVIGISLIAAAEKILFGRRQKYRKTYK